MYFQNSIHDPWQLSLNTVMSLTMEQSMAYPQVAHLMIHLFVTGSDFSLLYLTWQSPIRCWACGALPWLVTASEFSPVHRHLVLKLIVEIQKHPRSFTVFSKYSSSICHSSQFSSFSHRAIQSLGAENVSLSPIFTSSSWLWNLRSF